LRIAHARRYAHRSLHSLALPVSVPRTTARLRQVCFFAGQFA